MSTVTTTWHDIADSMIANTHTSPQRKELKCARCGVVLGYDVAPKDVRKVEFKCVCFSG